MGTCWPTEYFYNFAVADFVKRRAHQAWTQRCGALRKAPALCARSGRPRAAGRQTWVGDQRPLACNTKDTVPQRLTPKSQDFPPLGK